jgi:hypothetical protein
MSPVAIPPPDTEVTVLDVPSAPWQPTHPPSMRSNHAGPPA